MILDIQNDYFSDQARMPVASKSQIEPTLNSINDLIKTAVKRNEFERTQILSNCLRKFTTLKGSKGAELDERLLRIDGVFFSKNKPNAINNPNFLTYLKNNDINDLIVTDAFIEGCVTATVNGALARSFAVTVVSDTVAALTKLTTQDIVILTSRQVFENEDDKGEF